MKNRVQLSTDGHQPYLTAVKKAFKGEIDYASIIKLYGNSTLLDTTRRYAPNECTGIRKEVVSGNPDYNHISTSYVERQNLTMRMSMRRFARLSNAFSKKVDNHMHAISLHYMYYNFGRIHQTLKITPAMAAEISDHVWSLEEIAALIPEPAAKKRGPYKKRTSESAAA